MPAAQANYSISLLALPKCGGSRRCFIMCVVCGFSALRGKAAHKMIGEHHTTA
jgi:hypothetical protein